MSRTNVRRRSRSRSAEYSRGRSAQTPAFLLFGSFLIGTVLEWFRSQPAILERGWRVDTFAILVAAWVCVSLGARWPGPLERKLPLAAGLLLVVMFLGTLIMHVFLYPH